ncbi:MAG TPA: HAMP domain-containing sensor histidine kinase [Holophagaceae bacterium]|jgi:signal transduction histidine kinase|nr:HAMP domain-containing sensor histidine kinase [Holophagaceae bacterium]
MTALAVALPRLPVSQARALIGASLVAGNIFALLACLFRARRFPQETVSWQLMAGTMAIVIVANGLFATRHGDLSHWDIRDTWIVALHLLATITQTWAFLRLPITARHPEGMRMHLVGSLLFGSSIALLFWMLGLWQIAGTLSWLDQVLMALICLRASMTGGVVVYQVVDDPARLRGPLGWLLFAVTLGALPSLWALAQLASAPGRLLPPIAGLTPIYALTLVMAALHPSAVDAPSDTTKMRPLVILLLYLPYLASAVYLLLAMVGTAQRLVVPMVGFLAITTLLVIHQFALLHEVQIARNDLNARVQERTRALEENQALLLRTERMNSLGLLGAGIVHDLNNALTAINGSVDLARDSLQRKLPVKETDLARIESAAHHSAALSQRLMAFARRDAESEEQLDLAQLLEGDFELLRMLLPAQIRLEMEIGIGPFPLTASRGQIQQVLVNLVANARDAIASSGTVRVELIHDAMQDGQPCAVMAVSDSGSGMSSEVMEKLFQPLFTTKAPGKGTGLGLASVKVIADRMHGEIQVRSAPGAGTTFTIMLPLTS